MSTHPTLRFALFAVMVSPAAAWASIPPFPDLAHWNGGHFHPPYINEIAGGQRVDSEHPISRSTVALKVYSKISGSTTCSGTLVSPTRVITAAHCLFGAGQVRVSFGPQADQPEFETWATTASYPTNADAYAQKNRFDVGLVNLPAAPPEKFASADILAADMPIANGETVTVAGFGVSRYDSLDSGLLRSTKLLVSDDQYSPTEMLLRQTDTDATCPGDSGGPAFIRQGERYYLWGVANAGIGENMPCGSTVIYADARSKTIQDRLMEVLVPLSRPRD